MWIVMNDKHRQERQTYNLKESCQDCRNFCGQNFKCAMLYPVDPHQKKAHESAKNDERIYFCKMFEAK